MPLTAPISILEKSAMHSRGNGDDYPFRLARKQLSLLVIGGGNNVPEIIHAIASHSSVSVVRVIHPNISPSLRLLFSNLESLELVEREHCPLDLEQADLAIITYDNKQQVEAIADVAREKRVLVYATCFPELSQFTIVLNDRENSLPLHKNSRAGWFSFLPSITTPANEHEQAKLHWKKWATILLVAFGLMLTGHFIFSYLPLNDLAASSIDLYRDLDKNFHWMLLAGFLAQLVDGALGMGYGVTSATILLSSGVSPAAISGSIHTAEMFASGASGYSHYKFGNVNKKLFKALLIPGIIGAVLGAILLTHLGEKHIDILRPIMAGYTLLLGLRILLNAFRKHKPQKKFKRHGWLAGVGGFFDSFGGGGWGPIVTTTLITKGRSPRYVIGSVSLTEFFVTLASAFTFFTLLGVSHWQTILALIIGGLVAAPIAARLTGRLPRKTSFVLLGVLVITWSARILVKLL